MDKVEIYCINLLERNDRYEAVKKTFSESEIENVNFHRVKRHPKGGMYGCFESHFQVLDMAKSDIVIVFEDDCAINPNFGYNWADVLDIVENCMIGHDIDYFSIANVPIFSGMEETYENGTVVRCKSITTTGYAMKKKKFLELRQEMKDMVEGKTIIQHVDTYYLQNIKKSASFLVPMFCQNYHDTDNDWGIGSTLRTGINYLSEAYVRSLKYEHPSYGEYIMHKFYHLSVYLIENRLLGVGLSMVGLNREKTVGQSLVECAKCEEQ